MEPQESLDAVFKFDPLNPFPQTPLENSFRLGAKDHAKAADHWLGFRMEEVETRFRNRMRSDSGIAMRNDVETWTHLSPQIYLTPYLEIRALFEHLKPRSGSRVIDLGCGYTRIPFVLKRHFPDLSFTGFEVVKERVEESLRVLEQAQIDAHIECVDMIDPSFRMPPADICFLYDCGVEADIQSVLQKFLRNPSKTLVARGTRVRNLIDALSEFKKLTIQAETYQNLAIYKLKA